MIRNAFRQAVKGSGGVVILAGSDSDKAHIGALQEALTKYGIPLDVRIASAHKQAGRVEELVREYDTLEGPLLYIAVAGGTDALSGMVSWMSIRPVISCPPEFTSQKHINQSCLTNPPGSSNAYIFRPDNAARFAAQLFSYHYSSYGTKLRSETAKKVAALQEADCAYEQRDISLNSFTQGGAK